MPTLDSELAPDANPKTQELYRELKSKMPGYFRATLSLFKECFRSFPKLTAATIVISLADSAVKLGPLYLFGQLASKLAARDTTNLNFTMAALCACWVAGSILNSLRGLLNNRFQSKVKLLSEKQLFSAYLNKPLPTLGQDAFNEVASAAKMSTYNTGYFLNGNIAIVGNFTTCLLAGAAIISASPVIGGAFAALGIVELGLALINVKNHTLVEQQTSKIARIAGSLGWSLMGPERAQEFKNRGVVEREIERAQKLSAQVDDAHFLADKKAIVPNLTLSLLSDGLRIGLIFSLVGKVFSGAITEIGAPLQVLLMAGAFGGALSSFAGGIASQVRNYLQIAKRLALPLVGGVEREPGKSYIRLDLSSSPSVVLKDLKYEVDGKPLLNGVSFSFEPGKVYGLCGDSGAGKSTLMQMLTGAILPTGGEFLINGKPIQDVDIDDWRAQFSYMPQEFLIMGGYSVGDAINFGVARLTHPGNVHKALEIADASFIDPGKDLATLIGGHFGGREYSGGERQRIAIARAVIGQAKFLIVDEPTSKVGVANDTAVLERIISNARAHGQTVIIISHRYVNLRNVDQILYFEGGKIAEQGTHEDLMKTDLGYAKRFLKEKEGYED